MHILMLIGIGLVVLAAFILLARSLNRAGRAVDGPMAPSAFRWPASRSPCGGQKHSALEILTSKCAAR
jgi:hypothetical protein